MPKNKDDLIYGLAEPQHGYFTSAQAQGAGLRQSTLTRMAQRGTVELVSRGVYRIARYPLSPLGQYMEAVLWPQRGVIGVLSHQSALAFHELSDVSPAKVHITLPSAYRIRRDPPAYLTIHHARLADTDVQILNGIPVTSPRRSILDSHDSGVGRALIEQAINDGRASGKLRMRDAEELVELLGYEAPQSSAAQV